MTYTEYISQFEVYNNPPTKRGFHRHHIVPQEVQRNLYGMVVDNRQIYVTLPQHLWLHILYDRENGTKTSLRFLTSCGKPASYFTSYEKCMEYSDVLDNKEKERISKAREVLTSDEWKKSVYERTLGENNPMYGRHHTEESKRRMSIGHTGEKNVWFGQHWYNNGDISIRSFECPNGFVKGRLRRTK